MKYSQEQSPPLLDRFPRSQAVVASKRCKAYCIGCHGEKKVKAHYFCPICRNHTQFISRRNYESNADGHKFSEYQQELKEAALVNTLKIRESNPDYVIDFIDPTYLEFWNALTPQQQQIQSQLPHSGPVPPVAVAVAVAAPLAAESRILSELEVGMDLDAAGDEAPAGGYASKDGIGLRFGRESNEESQATEVAMDLDQSDSDSTEEDEDETFDASGTEREQTLLELDHDLGVFGHDSDESDSENDSDGAGATVQELEMVDSSAVKDNGVVVDPPVATSSSTSPIAVVTKESHHSNEPPLKKFKSHVMKVKKISTSVTSRVPRKQTTKCGGCEVDFKTRVRYQNHLVSRGVESHCVKSAYSRVDYSKSCNGLFICLGAFIIDEKRAPVLQAMEDGPSQLATGCGGLDCTFFCKNLHGSTKHQALAITSRLDKDWKRTIAETTQSIKIGSVDVKVEPGVNACIWGDCLDKQCSYISKSDSAHSVFHGMVLHKKGAITRELSKVFRRNAIAAALSDTFHQIYTKLINKPLHQLSVHEVAITLAAKLKSIESLSVEDLKEKRETLRRRENKSEIIEELVGMRYPEYPDKGDCKAAGCPRTIYYKNKTYCRTCARRDKEQRRPEDLVRLSYPRAVPEAYQPPAPQQVKYLDFTPPQSRKPAVEMDWNPIVEKLRQLKASPAIE